MDDVVKIVGMIFGVLFVLLIILAMQGMLGGEWTTTAQGVAPLSIALMVFGVSVAVLVGYVRR